MMIDASNRLVDIADRLIRAYDTASTLAPITEAEPDFSVEDAYVVLAELEQRRRDQGWKSVGRKIGFTNRSIWDRYGVWQPMWAHVWERTVHMADSGHATLSLKSFVQPRLEPEVVFKLKAPMAMTKDAEVVLKSVEWIAPGFEIVQSHFPNWQFTAADCSAAFGLHGALIVGEPLAVTEQNRAELADTLPAFVATLFKSHGQVVDDGKGANVLDSPALALAYLHRVLAGQPQFPQLAAGEIITTGTLTDAWPIQPGEEWSSDYGELGLKGLRVSFT